ncbi:MAG: type II toxin-antitoxin system RelE/ParE family toxin [Leeuwenhoekiella sp.]
MVWRKGALSHLESYCKYISEFFPMAAEKVRNVIFETAENLRYHPEKYPIDKYRKNNTGDIRAFEKYSLRVAYQITDTQIRILRVRHTSRNPQQY